MFFPRISSIQRNSLIARIGRIDEFKGAWNAGRLSGLGDERLVELRSRTDVLSTASAARLAGRRISDEEVAALLAAPMAGHLDRDARAMVGYRDVLARIHADDSGAIPFSAETVAEFRAQLFGERVERGRVGAARTGLKSPLDVSELVRSTTVALDSTRDHARYHPLLVIARFVVGFLAIRPFPDGNGRLATALATLLLTKHGYLHVAYAPLERVVEDHRAGYRHALEQSLKTLRRSPISYGALALFLIAALREQQLRAAQLVDGERAQLRLGTVQQLIFHFIGSAGRVTTTELARRFDMPPRTLRYHLRELTDRGLIEMRGHNRGRHYTLLTEPTLSAQASPDTDAGGLSTH